MLAITLIKKVFLFIIYIILIFVQFIFRGAKISFNINVYIQFIH